MCLVADNEKEEASAESMLKEYLLESSTRLSVSNSAETKLAKLLEKTSFSA